MQVQPLSWLPNTDNNNNNQAFPLKITLKEFKVQIFTPTSFHHIVLGHPLTGISDSCCLHWPEFSGQLHLHWSRYLRGCAAAYESPINSLKKGMLLNFSCPPLHPEPTLWFFDQQTPDQISACIARCW
uniref:Uncharacterized protein n=1 Tax=Opuntia streptacantha TaxID=393608 RepID=A0A7C9EAH9_OPUST